MDKNDLFKIIVIILLVAILGVLMYMTFGKMNSFYSNRGMERFPGGMMQEENEEKDVKEEDVTANKTTTEENIDLSEYDENVSIDKKGTYNLSGEYKHTLIIDADGEVVLNFNGVSIENDITGTIVNKSENPLVINLVDGTENKLIDGGSSEYNSCVFSYGPLTIKGNGSLLIEANQVDGEGIGTKNCDLTIESGDINIVCNDDGINAGGEGGSIIINGGNIYIKASGDGIDSNKDLIINGGSIYTIGSSVGGDSGVDTDGEFKIIGGNLIALGSDMLQNPSETTTQKYMSANLKEKVTKGAEVVIKDVNEKEIITFDASDDFRTIIVSLEDLNTGEYTVYIDGVKKEVLTVK